MCFDIDVDKLSLEELRDTLRRITMLLSKPTVVNNLPDRGHQLRLAKAKLEKEIKFREGLEATHHQMQKMSLRCASDSNIFTPHSSKLCSVEKKPERERFRPNLSLKPSGSGRTESMKDLHGGSKLIDLTTSLSLQVRQEERVKGEQVKSKQDRLMAFLKINDTDDTDSDDTQPDINLIDSVSENEEEEARNYYSDEEPGTSGLGRRIKPKRELKKPEKQSKVGVNSATLKTDLLEPEKESDTSVVQAGAVTTEAKEVTPESDKLSKKLGEVSNADSVEPYTDSTDPDADSVESNGDSTNATGTPVEATEKSLKPKDGADEA